MGLRADAIDAFKTSASAEADALLPAGAVAVINTAINNRIGDAVTYPRDLLAARDLGGGLWEFFGEVGDLHFGGTFDEAGDLVELYLAELRKAWPLEYLINYNVEINELAQLGRAILDLR